MYHCMVTVSSNFRRPHSGLQGIKMFPIGYVLLVLQSQLYHEAGCFAIHSVKSRTIALVFVAEGSSDELSDPRVPEVFCWG